MWYITTYMLTEFKNCATKIFKRKRYTTNKPCSSKIQLKFLSTIFYYFSIWKYFKIPFFIDSCRKGEECMPCHKDTTQQTQHVYSTLKPRRKDCFHVVSTWDTRGVFVGLSNVRRCCPNIYLAKQLFWNCALAWVFSWKYAAYFQNTFS